MTIGTTSVEAGWYRDPAGSPALRWWDGTQWTAHLQQPAPPAPPMAPAAPVSPVVQAQPAHQEVNLGAYRPGVGFGTGTQQPAQQSQQLGWDANPSGNGRVVPLGRVSNRLAWISFIAGILSVTAIFILASLPKGNFVLPVFGLTAIISGIRAIVGHRRGTVTVLWAPIIGLVLGTIAEFVILLGIIVTATGIGLGTTTDSPSNSTSQGSTPTTHGLIGPTGQIINYDAGYGTPQYLPTSNGELSAVTTQEAQVVATLQSDYAPSQTAAAAAAANSWPSGLSYSASGDVVSSDDRNLGNIIQPGWHLVYERQSDGNYLLGITGANTSEMALYSSKTDEYAVICESTDQTCVTASPLKPITSTNNAGSTTT